MQIKSLSENRGKTPTEKFTPWTIAAPHALSPNIYFVPLPAPLENQA